MPQESYAMLLTAHLHCEQHAKWCSSACKCWLLMHAANAASFITPMLRAVYTACSMPHTTNLFFMIPLKFIQLFYTFTVFELRFEITVFMESITDCCKDLRLENIAINCFYSLKCLSLFGP